MAYSRNKKLKVALERCFKDLHEKWAKHLMSLKPDRHEDVEELLRIEKESTSQSLERLWPAEAADLRLLMREMQKVNGLSEEMQRRVKEEKDPFKGILPGLN